MSRAKKKNTPLAGKLLLFCALIILSAVFFAPSGSFAGPKSGNTIFPAPVYRAKVSPAPGNTGFKTDRVATSKAAVCDLVLYPSATSLGPGEYNSLMFHIDLASVCPWKIQTTYSWIRIESNTVGVGSHSIRYSVDKNESPYSRTGYIQVNDSVFTIVQRGESCTMEVSPSYSDNISAKGADGLLVKVYTGDQCAWQVSSLNPSWIVITSPGSGGGTGPGQVDYKVAANESPAARKGQILIGDYYFTVYQDGASCDYQLDPVQTPLISPDGEDGVEIKVVASGEECPWEVEHGYPDWISVTSPVQGIGIGSDKIVLNVAANPDYTPRSASLYVAGKMCLVRQEGRACNYTLSPSESGNLPAAGATGISFKVQTSYESCPWSYKVTGADWITVTSPASESSGPGEVSFDVAENTSINPRQGSIEVEGQTYTVNQDGSECNYSLEPSSADNVDSSGAEVRFKVITASDECQWSVESGSASWLAVISPSGGQGTGPGEVVVQVAENNGTESRTGMVYVEGQTFTVNQIAAPCQFQVDPKESELVSATGAESVTFNVTANGENCEWDIAVPVDWIEISSPASGVGTGSGQVVFRVLENTSPDPRSAEVNIAGTTVQVRQKGVSCNFGVDPAQSETVSADGQTGLTVNVTATSDACGWEASSQDDWITITSPQSGAGTGNGQVVYDVAENTSMNPRQGTIDVMGQTHTVNQAGMSCNFAVDPQDIGPVDAAGENGITVNITATDSECPWNATNDNPSWITMDTPEGLGSGQISLDIAENPSSYPRQGSITIEGQVVNIRQQGAECNFAIDPVESELIPAQGGQGQKFAVAPTSTDCAWTVVSDAPSWIKIVSPGESGAIGPGEVVYDVSPSTSPYPRTGTITVAGQVFTVNQAGAECNFTIQPSSFDQVQAAGGGYTAQVTASSDQCQWEVQNNAPSWITIVSPASGKGQGSGNLQLTVVPNPNPSTRTGTVQVQGRTLSITQLGGTCSILVSPTTPPTVQAGGGAGYILQVAASSPECSWRAASTEDWIRLSSPPSGSGQGSGTISYQVLENTVPQARQGYIDVSGQRVLIRQSAGVCSYGVDPVQIGAVSSAGESGIKISVAATSEACPWTASANDAWLEISSGDSGVGSGSVTLKVLANTDFEERTGTLTVAGKTVTVLQEASEKKKIIISDEKLDLVASKTGAPLSAKFAIMSGDGPFTISTENGGTVDPATLPEPGTVVYTYDIPANQAETITDTIVIKDSAESTVKLPVTIQVAAIADIPGLNPGEESLAASVGPAYSTLNRIEAQGGTLTPAQEDLKGLLGEMLENSETSSSSVSQALEAITPEQSGASQQISTTTGKTQITNLTKRLTALRGGSTGVSIQGLNANYGGESIPFDRFQPLLDQAIRGGAAGDEETTFFDGRLGIFVTGQFNFGDKDSDQDVGGYKFDTKGITGGVDYWFTDDLVLGLAFGYAKTSVSYDSDGDLDLNSYLLSVYGNYYVWRGLYVEGLVGFGMNDYKSGRTIDYTITQQVKRDVKASYSGTQALLNLGVGYDYDINGFTIGGYGRFSWMPYFIDAFTESADSDDPSQHGLDMDFESQEFHSITTTLGTDFSYNLSTKSCVIIPKLGLEWEHEYANGRRAIDVAFSNAPGSDPFEVFTEFPDRDYFRISPGITFVFPRGCTIYLNYETTVGKTDMTEHTINVGGRLEF